jgi:hypothetical protein
MSWREQNIKIDLEETERKNINRIPLVQDGGQWRCLVKRSFKKRRRISSLPGPLLACEEEM